MPVCGSLEHGVLPHAVGVLSGPDDAGHHLLQPVLGEGVVRPRHIHLWGPRPLTRCSRARRGSAPAARARRGLPRRHPPPPDCATPGWPGSLPRAPGLCELCVWHVTPRGAGLQGPESTPAAQLCSFCHRAKQSSWRRDRPPPRLPGRWPEGQPRPTPGRVPCGGVSQGPAAHQAPGRGAHLDEVEWGHRAAGPHAQREGTPGPVDVVHAHDRGTQEARPPRALVVEGAEQRLDPRDEVLNLQDGQAQPRHRAPPAQGLGDLTGPPLTPLPHSPHPGSPRDPPWNPTKPLGKTAAGYTQGSPLPPGDPAPHSEEHSTQTEPAP